MSRHRREDVAWGFADQAVSSLTNLALAVVVARTVSPKGFGIYSLVFATYLVALGISRSLSTEPLVVRYTGPTRGALDDDASRSATGAALVLGLLGGVGCVIVSWPLSPDLEGPFLVLGITLPGLLLQDAWRQVFFARGMGRAALVNDTLWAGVLVLVLALMSLLEVRASTTSFVLAWGGAAACAALFGILQSGTIPRPAFVLRWIKSERNFAAPYLAEFLADTGSTQLVLYGIGLIAGLAAVGALRAGLVIFGPVTVIILAIWLFALPQQIRTLGENKPLFFHRCILVSAILSVGTLAYGLLASKTTGEVGGMILGRSWEPAREVLVPITFWVAGVAATVGSSLGLRALKDPRRGLWARGSTSLILVVFGLLGAATLGASGAVWGVSIGVWIGVLFWWSLFLRSYRRSPEGRPPPHSASKMLQTSNSESGGR